MNPDKRFGQIERKLDSLYEAVAKLTVDMQAGFARVDEQFEKMDTKFEGKFDVVNSRLDDLMEFLKEKLK